jgi:hypothetical protein
MSTPNCDLPALIAQQKFRLWLFGGMLGLAGLGLLFTEEIANILSVAALSVRFAALLVTFSALAAAFVAIRCPFCGLKLVFYAMSQKGVGEWLHWLLEVRTCPKCGQSHEVKNDISATK